MNRADLLAAIAETAQRAWPDAVSLPPVAYFSGDLLELEIAQIFRCAWLCVGHISQLAEEGSYLTADVAGAPIAIIRLRDGALSVVSNSCAHRGARILSGQGRTRRLVCPYHGWSYDPTGALAHAPGVPAGDSRLVDCRLPRVRHELWNGWIHVTLDDDARPLAPILAGLGDVVLPYRMTDMRALFAVQEEFPVNWKLLVENFMESYHLPVVHPQTLNRTTPLSGVRCWPGGEGFTYHTLEMRSATSVAACSGEAAAQPTFRDIEVLACIFPSNLLSVTARTCLSLSVQPFGAEGLRASVVCVAAPELLEQSGEDVGAIARNKRASFDAFNLEDKAVIARLCAGLRSPLARSGPLAPLERPLWEFHRYLANRLCERL